jgi:hypothetical protein
VCCAGLTLAAAAIGSAAFAHTRPLSTFFVELVQDQVGGSIAGATAGAVQKHE